MQFIIVSFVIILLFALFLYLIYKQIPSNTNKQTTTIVKDMTPLSIKQDKAFKKMFKDKLIELLTVNVYIDDDYYSSVLWQPLRPDLLTCEYIRIGLHYYAKMLFNYDSNDKDMKLAAEMQRMALERVLIRSISKNTNLLELADIADVVKLVGRPNDNSSVIVATLYSMTKPLRHLRHITTTVPPDITTQKTVFSVFILFQAIIEFLDNEGIKIFEKALQYMNHKYSSGYNYSSPESLDLPNQAYIAATMS